MISVDPCRHLNSEYVDAINNLQAAKNDLEKIINAQKTTRTHKKALDRVRKAEEIFRKARKALEECQNNNQVNY